jgi:hypothetical protein
MQLDEALSTIADKRKRLAQLTGIITAAARYQDGEPPAEDASALLNQARVLMTEIQTLGARINLTNSTTRLDDGRTLTEALARRAILGTWAELLNRTADAATGEGKGMFGLRRTRSELTEKTDMDVPALREEASRMAQERRELDLTIQRAGMTAELAEA